MGLWDRFKIMAGGDLPPARPRDHRIARQAYADFLRAQLMGYDQPGYAGLLETLDRSDAAETPDAPVSFAALMGVETRMAGLMSDDLVERNYWIVRDRLERVGSPAGIARHEAWVPPSMRQPVTGPPADEPTPVAADEADTGPGIDLPAMTQAAATAEAEARSAIAIAIALAEAEDAAPGGAAAAPGAGLPEAQDVGEGDGAVVSEADPAVGDVPDTSPAPDPLADPKE